MQKPLVLLPLLITVGAQAQVVANNATAAAPDLYARDSYRIDTLVCPFKGRIEYEPGEIECGLLQVPENREDPDSRLIELHFVKLNSTWDDEDDKKENEEDEDEEDVGLEPGRRDDPVIYLTGGPGADVEYYVDRFNDHGIRKHRDLYILEQRGIANSGDFCERYYSRNPAVSNVNTLAKSAEAARIAAEACVRNATAAGVDIRAYNTIENARDVKALRIALGFGKWNVWGISYGTLLGQAYIKEDPDGILAVVLDAIVPLDARDDVISWRLINWYDRDLKKLDELCQADDDCADSFPALGERVRDAARATKDAAITVDVEDTETFPTGKAYVLSDIATYLPFTFLYEQSNYPALPAIIYAWVDAIENRDEALFKAIATALSQGVFGGSQGMYDAIMCNDGYREAAIASTAVDRAEFPVLTNAISVEGDAEAWAQSCIDLGAPPRPREDFAAVQTDIPTLLIEGDMDPITPPPLAHVIAPGFTNGTYVEFPYAGHGPSRSVECAGDLLNKFYDNPNAEPDLGCVDEMEAPEFYVPLYTTGIATRLLLIAVEDKKKLAGPAAWGGISMIISMFAFLFLSLAAIGRRIDKRQPVDVGGARWSAWLAATFATTATVIFGVAIAVTFDASEILVIFGLVPWAWFGAIAGLLGGLFGAAVIVLTVRARLKGRLPIGTLVGFLMTGIATVGLSSFLLYWDLGPF